MMAPIGGRSASSKKGFIDRKGKGRVERKWFGRVVEERFHSRKGRETSSPLRE